MMDGIDREPVRRLLRRWQRGDIDERQVHQEAEDLWGAAERTDYPEGDPRSIALEVISQLEILNHQLIIQDDIPAMVKFLETKAGAEFEGWTHWRRYWDQIDFDERRRRLQSNPYYST